LLEKRPVDGSIGPNDGARTSATAGGVGGGQRVTADDAIAALIARARRIAVLGIKPEWTGQPAYYVPAYAQRAGFEIVPVPVYYPDVTEMLGSPVYRRLVDIPGPIDVVNVFRRPADVPAHLDDILAKAPRAVWMQLGIRHDAVAQQLVNAGIDVVQDRCLLIDLQRLGR
jgi:predicted CoA-binding protein